MTQAYEDERAKIAATRERQLADAVALNAEMRVVLRLAKGKLKLYRAEHSGAYVGGMEFSELMRRIDAVLDRG